MHKRIVGLGVFAKGGACICGLSQRSVCTYTTSRVPATKTKKLGDVLEVGGLGIVEYTREGRISIAIKARDGLGNRVLRWVPRLRRGAGRRAIRLLLGLSTALDWRTGHFELCVM
jgi:hypothetical protein